MVEMVKRIEIPYLVEFIGSLCFCLFSHLVNLTYFKVRFVVSMLKVVFLDYEK
ncbi:hypothetical protein FUAX_13150 [Fulvitalea axinellae]|uniref:Uncharacterized protein n=1 Tax=Fulvitalea axinellae TaxID=1182444 RepID=A0AAU9CLF4_9BACT|nr:hypothetical protein FUAX_13150 [Fulvitalea axinellae]